MSLKVHCNNEGCKRSTSADKQGNPNVFWCTVWNARHQNLHFCSAACLSIWAFGQVQIGQINDVARNLNDMAMEKYAEAAERQRHQ